MQELTVELVQRALDGDERAAREKGGSEKFTHRAMILEPSRSDANIERAASEAGLNVAQWRRDLESNDVAHQLADDAKLVKTLSLRSAPVLFVNGYKYQGVQSVDKLNDIVRQRATD